MEDELGDLLFAIANLGRFLALNPEEALRKTISRFQKRFSFVEDELLSQGVTMQNATLEEMDVLWEKAKEAERENKF
jgi:tetrapyrrole methylase family protein/MazG family protein